MSIPGQRDELRLVVGILASFGAAPIGKVGGWVAPADLDAVTVLDCGGGTGRIAVALAQLGAQVTVVDISVDALATLSRRAIEAGVADRVYAVQGDVEALGECLGDQLFDLALLHGVLDAVDPAVTLSGLRAVLRPGGAASVLVTNPAAGIIAKVLGGELEAALEDLRGGADFGASAITRLCEQAGFEVEQVRGVGVFSELIPFGAPGGVTAAGNSVGEIAAELEARSSDVAPFRDIAGRLHVLARRPLVTG
jgi:S-adenosylmethionine-dependent methyltransferase